MTEPQLPLLNDASPLREETLQLKADEPTDPMRTLRLEAPPVLEDPDQTQKRQVPTRVAGRRRLGGRMALWAGGVAALLGGCYLLWLRLAPAPGPTASPVPAKAEDVPAGLHAYLAQARAGDAHAMRMLGVMYYYGLNVPQDREKGLYWYREAAAKGSEAAREDLARLQAIEKK